MSLPILFCKTKTQVDRKRRLDNQQINSMKTSIKEYLQEHDKAQINDLAAALGKEGAKDFRDLVKTIS